MVGFFEVMDLNCFPECSSLNGHCPRSKGPVRMFVALLRQCAVFLQRSQEASDDFFAKLFTPEGLLVHFSTAPAAFVPFYFC